MTIRVMAVDDHPVVRAGMSAMIENEPDMQLVAEATNGVEAVALYEAHGPDVVLMDLRMPHMNGVEATRAIVAAHPDARIIALTSYEGDTNIHRALGAGARGYLLKDMIGVDVIRAIRTVAAGERVIPTEVARQLAAFTPRLDLTAREIEILGLVAKGLKNRDIARAIGRAEPTVKLHIKHAMAKLDADDRTEAVTIALQRGIIHLDSLP